jgi:hypothetical protein
VAEESKTLQITYNGSRRSFLHGEPVSAVPETSTLMLLIGGFARPWAREDFADAFQLLTEERAAVVAAAPGQKTTSSVRCCG